MIAPLDPVALRKSRDRIGYLYRKATRRLAQLERAQGDEARQLRAEQTPRREGENRNAAERFAR